MKRGKYGDGLDGDISDSLMQTKIQELNEGDTIERLDVPHSSFCRK